MAAKQNKRTSAQKLDGLCEFIFGGKPIRGPVPVRFEMAKWRAKQSDFIQRMQDLAKTESSSGAAFENFLGLINSADEIAALVHAFAPWIPPENELSKVATDTEYYAAYSQMVAIANPPLAVAASVRAQVAANQIERSHGQITTASV